MTFVLVGVFVLYGLLVMFLYIGWVKAISQKLNVNSQAHFFSIVIPVRNESDNIALLVADLALQKYPNDRFEVIIVDDHSEDSTRSLTRTALKVMNVANIKVIQSPGKGKKAALDTGINHASGTIILTTDADCRLTNNWLQSVNAAFAEDSVKMVFGAVKIEPDSSLFSKMQAQEFSSLIGSGAASMAFNIPSMCNGANLAFRKEVFQEVGGYTGNERIASGDDEFLLRKIFAKYPKGIRFNNFQESIVKTQALSSFSQFISQRLRWAGKWKHHSDVGSKLLAFCIFLFHVFTMLMPFLFITGYVGGDVILSLFFVKAMLEYVFLRATTSWLRIAWHWPSFIILQFLYSFYAVSIGIASLVITPAWKGRK
jgi:biofilm PGA synthesis N-glycosyltransferase PgaC